MLKKTLIPTRLIEPHARTPVPIVEALPPSRLRGAEIIGRALAWWGRVLRLKLTRKLTPRLYAITVRELLEELGGLWIKLGQLLSLRVDIFSPELCDELGKLVDRAAGFPGDLAARFVEDELGRPISDVFDVFEQAPFAAASIGQVHRALLKEEQIWVAVKVQRPYIAQVYERELAFIKSVTRWLDRFKVLPVMRWDVMCWELHQIMREEVDYRYEASAMERMRRNLRRHKTYVPMVFEAYSTQRILVTEFVHAVLMGDFIRVLGQDRSRIAVWCTENNVQPRTLARRMIFSLLRQIFEDNLYHADLHPGNIILLRNNRIALIDFGAVSFTESEYLTKFRFFIEALANKDFARAADLIILLSPALPPMDLEKVKDRIIRALRAWATRARVRTLGYHDKSLSTATVEVIKILYEENCPAEWGFLRLRRALTTLDASLIHLYPTADYTKLCKRYFVLASRREIMRVNARKLITQGVTGMNKMLQMLGRAEETTLFHAAMIRRHATMFQGATTRFGAFLSDTFGLVAKVAVVAGLAGTAVYMRQYYPATIVPVLHPEVAAMLNNFPQTTRLWWLFYALADGYLFVSALRLRRRFRKKVLRLPETRVAV